MFSETDITTEYKKHKCTKNSKHQIFNNNCVCNGLSGKSSQQQIRKNLAMHIASNNMMSYSTAYHFNINNRLLIKNKEECKRLKN